MRKISADVIYTVENGVIHNGMIIVDDKGKILAVENSYDVNDTTIEIFNGAIVPGFINAHCHLELSHLKDKIKPGTGLISFIKSTMSMRKADDAEVVKAMEAADKKMWENGIVGVGDISNVSISNTIKTKSKLRYHTFIEMIGIDPEKAVQLIENANKLRAEFTGSSSITPHAPYTLSKLLLRKLRSYCKHRTNPISIHNQENSDENKMYRYKTGAFVDMYEEMGISLDHFVPMSKNTLQAVVPLLPDNQKVMMVHNTFTSFKDIYMIRRFSKDIYWCFCPKANLYIENTLPEYEFFERSDTPILIGTDSLASNDSLDILEEIKVIQKNYEHATLEKLIKWATLNGAQYFGWDEELGSIKKGKIPGLNLIDNLRDGRLTEKSKVTKLI